MYVLGQKCKRAYKFLRNKCKERKGWCCKKKEINKEEEPVHVVNKETNQSQRHQRRRVVA